MINRRALILFGIVLVGAVSGWTQQRSYVLKSGDGERLPGDRQTFIKASPRRVQIEQVRRERGL